MPSEKTYKKNLSPNQFHILRENGDELPHTGTLLGENGKGLYECAACANPVFASRDKQPSDRGWPVFSAPFVDEKINISASQMARVKGEDVRCSECNSHLGYVTDDKTIDGGERYSINSVALNFLSTVEELRISGDPDLHSGYANLRKDQTSISDAIGQVEKPKIEGLKRHRASRLLFSGLILTMVLLVVSVFFAGGLFVKPEDLNPSKLLDAWRVDETAENDGEASTSRGEALNQLIEEGGADLEGESAQTLLEGNQDTELSENEVEEIVDQLVEP